MLDSSDRRTKKGADLLLQTRTKCSLEPSGGNIALDPRLIAKAMASTMRIGLARQLVPAHTEPMSR
jgi:hypothetical protein